MDIRKIYSRNAAFQKFGVLRTNRNKRYKYGEFLVEGVRNINEAAGSGWEFTSLIYDGEKSLSGWAREILGTVKTRVNYELTGELMEEISGKQDTSELLAIVRMRRDDPARLVLSPVPLLMLFDRPSNRGNLGTVIRSCDSLGADGLLLTGHGVDLYDPEVVGASMGSFFRLPSVRMTDNDALFQYIDGLRAKYPGFQVVGTTAHREKRITQVDFTRPTLLLIGNETEGLSRAFKEKSDVLATIPMSGRSCASSFNVGCDATVFLYEAVRQRMQALSV